MSEPAQISARDLEIANEFARRFAERCDPCLFQITIFGSRARGDADQESDLDLFVALREEDTDRRLKKAARNIACDLTIESGILVSVLFADKEFLRQHEGFSLLQTIKEEGVPL